MIFYDIRAAVKKFSFQFTIVESRNIKIKLKIFLIYKDIVSNKIRLVLSSIYLKFIWV